MKIRILLWVKIFKKDLVNRDCESLSRFWGHERLKAPNPLDSINHNTIIGNFRRSKPISKELSLSLQRKFLSSFPLYPSQFKNITIGIHITCKNVALNQKFESKKTVSWLLNCWAFDVLLHKKTMPSKLKKAIGAVKDQTSISLAKVASNASSSLDVAVLKATTHDDVPMDERYVHEILHLVSSNQSNAASCARGIGKRISRTRNWIVAVKSLMLVLRIFQDGDPYFPREVLHAMKRGAKILNLTSFRDDSNSSPWDYTAFVRTFSLYLDERLDCFLTGKLQRRYTHHEREPFHRRSRQGT